MTVKITQTKVKKRKSHYTSIRQADELSYKRNTYTRPAVAKEELFGFVQLAGGRQCAKRMTGA
jgi:hypothetical protein